jgi:hypothetical protein
MAEQPTHEQRVQAAYAALKGMTPPVTEDNLAPVTVGMIVTIVASQQALVADAVREVAPPRESVPMILEMLEAPSPELEQKVEAHNAAGRALCEEIRHYQPPQPTLNEIGSSQ